MDLGPVDHAAPEVAEAAVERDLAAREDADAERVLRARVEHGDVFDAPLVEQPAQLEVDLARRQVLCVEDGLLAVDVGDLENRVVDLDKPARVVRDHALAGQRVHTITSPSYGSHVSISWSTIARIAISSEASATMSSAS